MLPIFVVGVWGIEVKIVIIRVMRRNHLLGIDYVDYREAVPRAARGIWDKIESFCIHHTKCVLKYS